MAKTSQELIEAQEKIIAALRGLTDDERRRVIACITILLGIDVGDTPKPPPKPSPSRPPFGGAIH